MPVAEFEEKSWFESHFCRRPLKPSQDYLEPNFSGKVFKFVDKTQFEALLQTQAAAFLANEFSRICQFFRIFISEYT